MTEYVDNVRFLVEGGIMEMPGMMSRARIDELAEDMSHLGGSLRVLASAASGQTLFRDASGTWHQEVPENEISLSEISRPRRIRHLRGDYGYGIVDRKIGDHFLATFTGPLGHKLSAKVGKNEVRLLADRITARVIPLSKDHDGYWEDREDYADIVDVTNAVLSLSPEDIMALRDNHETSDRLAFEAGYAWPFRVVISKAVEEYFSFPSGALSGDRVANLLSEAELAQCRELAGFEAPLGLKSDATPGI